LELKKGEKDAQKVEENKIATEDGFWKFLLERDKDNCLMGCSIKG